MNKQTILLMALVIFGLSISPIAPRHSAVAQPTAGPSAAAQKATSSNNLTATFNDYDALGSTLQLLRSDDYNGSGQATYTASSSHNSSLISEIKNGDWNFNLANQSLRTLYVTPNAAIDNLQPPGPPAGYYRDGV